MPADIGRNSFSSLPTIGEFSLLSEEVRDLMPDMRVSFYLAMRNGGDIKFRITFASHLIVRLVKYLISFLPYLLG